MRKSPRRSAFMIATSICFSLFIVLFASAIVGRSPYRDQQMKETSPHQELSISSRSWLVENGEHRCCPKSFARDIPFGVADSRGYIAVVCHEPKTGCPTCATQDAGIHREPIEISPS